MPAGALNSELIRESRAWSIELECTDGTSTTIDVDDDGTRNLIIGSASTIDRAWHTTDAGVLHYAMFTYNAGTGTLSMDFQYTYPDASAVNASFALKSDSNVALWSGSTDGTPPLHKFDFADGVETDNRVTGLLEARNGVGPLRTYCSVMRTLSQGVTHVSKADWTYVANTIEHSESSRLFKHTYAGLNTAGLPTRSK